MKQSLSDKILKLIAYFVVGLFAVLCIYPLLLTFGVSFSNENLVQINGYRLIPEKFSTDAYNYLFQTAGKRIVRAYANSIIVTIGGTLLAMLVNSMAAYAISLKELRYRNGIALFSYFTVIFSAGTVPWYIVCVNVLHLKNTILALILPYIVDVWFLFMLRNYFSGIPDSIFESAKIDGAGQFTIYWKIAIPLSKTALLTVGLLYSLKYWNDWWLPLTLLSKPELYTLQYFLYSITSNVQALTRMGGTLSGKITLPTETVKMAATIITMGPIIFLYPAVQKYFVKGIMVGGVKG